MTRTDPARSSVIRLSPTPQRGHSFLGTLVKFGLARTLEQINGLNGFAGKVRPTASAAKLPTSSGGNWPDAGIRRDRQIAARAAPRRANKIATGAEQTSTPSTRLLASRLLRRRELVRRQYEGSNASEMFHNQV